MKRVQKSQTFSPIRSDTTEKCTNGFPGISTSSQNAGVKRGLFFFFLWRDALTLLEALPFGRGKKGERIPRLTLFLFSRSLELMVESVSHIHFFQKINVFLLKCCVRERDGDKNVGARPANNALLSANVPCRRNGKRKSHPFPANFLADMNWELKLGSEEMKILSFSKAPAWMAALITGVIFSPLWLLRNIVKVDVCFLSVSNLPTLFFANYVWPKARRREAILA